jgi:hypothetical protein
MATAPILETEKPSALEVHKKDALEFAKQFTIAPIVDRESYELAGESLRQVVAKRRWWQLIVGPARDAAHKAHAAVCTMEKTVDAPLANLELQLKSGLKEYLRQEEQKRLAEESRIRDQLRKAEEARTKLESEEAKLNAAIEAEECGDAAAAEAILEAPTPQLPVYVPPVIVPSLVAKQAGISTKKNWKARVINPDLVPREFLMVDESKLNKYAKAMQEQARVAGVEFYDEGTIAVRG